MSWGDSWGNRPGNNARVLAYAFQDGRSLGHDQSRGCVEADSDGMVWYFYAGQAIARRIVNDDWLIHYTARALEGRSSYKKLEFRAGHADKATARHLNALGVHAEWQYDKRPFLINGVAVDNGAWYSLDVLAGMPKWEEPVTRPRPSRIYVPNPSLPLFT